MYDIIEHDDPFMESEFNTKILDIKGGYVLHHTCLTGESCICRTDPFKESCKTSQFRIIYRKLIKEKEAEDAR